MRKFDFLLIGAQKSGTTWLWGMLDQHPGVDLPDEKEIHYFGGVELYRRGPAWYYAHFEDVRPDLLTGEASTSYLYDRIPYWNNDDSQIEYADDLPTIPELVAAENPDAKIVVILRDPVRRAFSAYRHWMRKGDLSPLLGLRRVATELPKMRILEYGFYARHLAAWRKVFRDDQIKILLFEEDVKSNPESGLREVFSFLGLDEEFLPVNPDRTIHKSWSWTRSAVEYYAGPFRRVVRRGAIGEFLNRSTFLDRLAVRRADIEFLRECYLPEKEQLESILGRSLDVWDYGESLLTK
jgi:hypothetical protein